MPPTSQSVERKTFPVKTIGDGTIDAIISTFKLDRSGDIMTKDAFADAAGKEIPMAGYGHDWDHPVGKGVVTVTDDHAEFHGQFFLDTEHGSETFKLVRNMGALQEYSIGFRTIDAAWDTQDGESVRTIKKIELFEASPVLVGAAYDTGTLSVKAAHRQDAKAAWTAAYVNDLPDSAFAWVESGGTKDDDGKTTPRSLRHLPHHDSSGAVDEPHLRNALARFPATEGAPQSALTHLEKHADALGIGDDGKAARRQAPDMERIGELAQQIDAASDELLAALGLPDADKEARRTTTKAGRTMSQRNLDALHTAIKGMAAVHDATCDMQDDCPLASAKSIGKNMGLLAAYAAVEAAHAVIV